jgi:hypothetical protein
MVSIVAFVATMLLASGASVAYLGRDHSRRQDVSPASARRGDEGVSLGQAIDDVFANQSAYVIGCYTATKLVMVKGVLDFYDRVRQSPTLASFIRTRLLADQEPLYDVEPPSAWSFEPGFDPKESSRPGKLLSIIPDVAPKNFIPGDWVYFVNDDPVSKQKTGYEGSNAIYLGDDRFDDYYGENNHAFSYEEKLDEVFQWRNGVFSRERDASKRQPLTAEDLDRLSASPRRGGMVQSWRITPDFFEAPAKRRPMAKVRTSSTGAHPVEAPAASPGEGDNAMASAGTR